MRVFRPSAVLVALLSVASCSDDATDPCADIGCGVEGADLAIVDFAIDYRADQAFDERVGARLVQPGDEITLRYRIVSRGTERTGPTHLRLGTEVRSGNLGTHDPRYLATVEVPALDPREVLEGVVTVLAPSGSLRSDQVTAVASLESESGQPYADADLSNQRSELSYRIGQPVLEVVLATNGDTIRTGDLDTVRVEVVNASPVADLDGDYEVGLCVLVLVDELSGPVCGHYFFVVEPMSTVPASGLAYLELRYTLPANAFLFESEVYGLRACIGHAAENDDERYASLARGACADARLDVRPNLAVACSPPTVALPATLAVSDADSDCLTDAFEYDVWAFDVESPGIHSISQVQGITEAAAVFGPDHERIDVTPAGEFFAPVAGRYHVAVHSWDAQRVYTLE